MWSVLHGNEKIRLLYLKHQDLIESLIANKLPEELSFDFMLSNFRSVTEPYEIFNEMELVEIIRRLDIKHFNAWLEEEYERKLTKN